MVNHHIRYRDHDKIIPKQTRLIFQPNLAAHDDRSQKSNWASSPGSVWIGTDTESAARNLGPRMLRTALTTVGYEPSKPFAASLLWMLTDCILGHDSSIDEMRCCQCSVITVASVGRVAGGGPSFRYLLTVVRCQPVCSAISRIVHPCACRSLIFT